jgi:hypothetical protein
VHAHAQARAHVQVHVLQGVQDAMRDHDVGSDDVRHGAGDDRLGDDYDVRRD